MMDLLNPTWNSISKQKHFSISELLPLIRCNTNLNSFVRIISIFESHRNNIDYTVYINHEGRFEDNMNVNGVIFRVLSLDVLFIHEMVSSCDNPNAHGDIAYANNEIINEFEVTEITKPIVFKEIINRAYVAGSINMNEKHRYTESISRKFDL